MRTTHFSIHLNPFPKTVNSILEISDRLFKIVILPQEIIRPSPENLNRTQ